MKIIKENEFQFAIDVLKDELNELIEMQQEQKLAIHELSFKKKRIELEKAIKYLKSAIEERFILIKGNEDDTFTLETNKLTYFEIIGILTHFRDHLEADRIQEINKN